MRKRLGYLGLALSGFLVMAVGARDLLAAGGPCSVGEAYLEWQIIIVGPPAVYGWAPGLTCGGDCPAPHGCRSHSMPGGAGVTIFQCDCVQLDPNGDPLPGAPFYPYSGPVGSEVVACREVVKITSLPGGVSMVVTCRPLSCTTVCDDSDVSLESPPHNPPEPGDKRHASCACP